MNVITNMKKLLILGFGILSFGISYSQQDTTKKKGSIDITSAFKPILKESAKINFNASPAVNDTTKPRLNYDIPNQNLLFAYTPGSLRPLALEIDYNGYWDLASYIKAGFGNYTTPYVKAGLGFGDGKAYLVNFYGSYISSKGKIKHQDYAQFEAKTTGSLFTKSNEIYGSASMGRQDYFLYGYDHNVYDYKKSDVKTFRIEFLIRFHCPESVFQIIFFRCRSSCHGIVTTVVIGKNQTLAGNHLACTETAKTYDGIFQTGIVHRIDFFRSQMQTFFLHIHAVQTFYKHQKPHPFVSSHLRKAQ